MDIGFDFHASPGLLMIIVGGILLAVIMKSWMTF